MNVSDLLSALPAKLAALGLAAKASLGVGLATVGVAAAGTAGVLPNELQHDLAQVVDSTTGINLPDPIDDLVPDRDLPELPDPSDITIPEVSIPDVSIPDVTTPELGEDDGEDGDDQRKANHGACVSAVAHQKPTDGSSHGQAVSAAARSDCGKDSATGSTPDITTPTTIDDDDESSEESNRGPGNGNGNANGHRGSGSSGGNSGPGHGNDK